MAYTLAQSFTDSETSTTIAGAMETLATELGTLQGTFKGAFDGIESSRSAVNFGNWEDEVQGNLQDHK